MSSYWSDEEAFEFYGHIREDRFKLDEIAGFFDRSYNGARDKLNSHHFSVPKIDHREPRIILKQLSDEQFAEIKDLIFNDGRLIRSGDRPAYRTIDPPYNYTLNYKPVDLKRTSRDGQSIEGSHQREQLNEMVDELERLMNEQYEYYEKLDHLYEKIQGMKRMIQRGD